MCGLFKIIYLDILLIFKMLFEFISKLCVLTIYLTSFSQ